MSAAPLPAAVEDYLTTFRARVAEDLLLLATLHDREPDSELLQQLKSLDFPYCLTFLPNTGPAAGAISLLHKTLSELQKHPDQNIMDELAADYASIYLNHKISASPEESVWLDEDSLMCQDSMFQVRSCFESEGLEIPDWRLRPDDHLVYQLQFIAHLLNKDERIETLEQVATFMDEHLLRWLGNFGERVLARCETTYFAGIAAITAANGEELRDILADVLQQPRPSREEIELRMKPKPAPQEAQVRFMPGMGPTV
jgi:TorA maturation chaperone TorD